MSETYSGQLSGSNKGFDFNGKHYKANDQFGPLTACEAIGFMNASTAANPDKGFSEEQQKVIDKMNAACTAQTNNTAPGADAGSAPAETNPDAGGNGDSGDQQGAPNPGVAGTVTTTIDGGDSQDDGSTDNSNPPPPGDEPTRPNPGEADESHGGDQPQQKTDAGDPVDLFSGSFYMEETDLVIPNTLIPLAFTRFYRSGAASYGPFGWNWDHNFNRYLRELNSGDIAGWKNLHEDVYVFDGIRFEPPTGKFEKLERIGDQIYEISSRDGLIMHFEYPGTWTDAERIPLVWITDSYKNKLTFTYGAENKLTDVRDDDDRFFSLEYDICGLLVSVADQAGRQFSYAHDEQTMQLVCVTSPATTDHPEGIVRQYHYEEPWALPELRHNILRVEDNNGNVYLENKYEQDPASWSYARITEQLFGGFLFQFRYTNLQWVPSSSIYVNIPAVRVEMMNPDYGVETYTFNYRGDLLDRRFRLSLDGSYRVVVHMFEYDEQGNLVKTTNPDGSDEIKIYDAANTDPRMRNNLLQKEITAASGFPSPSRIIWKAQYESAFQKLIQETDEAGHVTIYKYDFDLTPASPANNGKLLAIHYPDALLPDGTFQQAKKSFEYNAHGLVTLLILPDGTRNEMLYGSAGNQKNRLVKQLFDTSGANITHETLYDAFGYVAEILDGRGNITKQVTNALGQTEISFLPPVNGRSVQTKLHYDGDKRVISIEKPKGNYEDASVPGDFIVDIIERNVMGYPTKYFLSSNTGESRTIRISNDFRGQQLELLNPDGSQIKRNFDERGLLIKEAVIGIDGSTMSSETVYNRLGRIIQETDAFGLTKKFEYDGFARLIHVTTADGTIRNTSYAKNDLIASEEIIGDDGSGTLRQLSFRSYTYDSRNRKVSESVKAFSSDPNVFSNVKTSWFHDPLNRIVKIVNNRGAENQQVFDGLGRLQVVTDFEGNRQELQYDNNANVIGKKEFHKEPNGSLSIIIQRFAYDERNRLTQLIEPGGSITESVYDDRNLLIRKVDQAGIVGENFYNSYNEKILQVSDSDGLNITEHWTIDSMSRITEYKDPDGEVSRYFFDGVGRNYKIKYPNGFQVIKTFNGLNQVSGETLASGVEIEYDYDSMGRISKITSPVAPASIVKIGTHEFVYDGLGRPVLAAVEANQVTRSYDSQGRLLSETSTGDTMMCSYDDAAGTVEKWWPDGRKEKLSHNMNGILTKIEESQHGSLGSGNATICSLLTSGPNTMGSAIYTNGITIDHVFDERKRLVEKLAHAPSGLHEQISYRYNSADKKQVEYLTGQNPKHSFFEYDGKYRLHAAKNGFSGALLPAFTQNEHYTAIGQVQADSLNADHVEMFNYDSASARSLYKESGEVDKNYSYFPGHVIQSDGVDAYTQFHDGSLKSAGAFEFVADSFGRIISIKSGAQVLTEIQYDAFGRPSIIKELGRPVRSFNWLGGFVEQENENGIATRQISILPGTGIPIAYHTPAGTHYTMFDDRFNLTALIDSAGTVLETYRYNAFGSPSIYDAGANKVPQSAFNTEPVFGGQKFLSSCGFYLSKKRLMDPENGMYLSADPKGYQDAPTLYAYTAQDPVNQIDPNGEVLPLIAAAVIIGALVGAGYCIYDAATHPDSNKYDGWGALKALPYTFGGAAVGGIAAVGGEGVLAVGGTGAFVTGGTATTLTAGQTFLLYGASSAVSGGISRGGFNYMFPEYVDPVSVKTVATDFGTGGTLGVGFRSLANLVNSPGFGQFNWLPSMGKFGQWLRFGADQGGEAAITGQLGPYPGRIGSLLNKVGIRQGYISTVTNKDLGTGNVFGAVDTGAHEGFHAFLDRFFPTWKNLSSQSSLAATARYPEEVLAYTIGHGAAGRFHAIPFAAFEAFKSLGGYTPAEQEAAKIFWGRIGGAAGVGIMELLFGGGTSKPKAVSSK